MIGSIYLIVNRQNGKVYVGQTANTLSRRLAHHRHEAKLKRRKVPLYQAVGAYGWENFDSFVVAVAHSKTKLDDLEILWIAVLRSTDRKHGYNLAKGGRGPWNRGVPNPEFAARMRGNKIWQGRKHSAASRKLLSSIARNRPPMPDAVRARISEKLTSLGTRPPVVRRYGKDNPMFGRRYIGKNLHLNVQPHEVRQP